MEADRASIGAAPRGAAEKTGEQVKFPVKVSRARFNTSVYIYDEMDQQQIRDTVETAKYEISFDGEFLSIKAKNAKHDHVSYVPRENISVFETYDFETKKQYSAK